MANIQQYLDNIAKAEQGEDVRWSIHNGIDAINKEVVKNSTECATAVEQATLSSTAAQNSANDAATSAEAANTAVERYGSAFAILTKMPALKLLFEENELGPTLTDDLYKDIQDGTFKKVKIGSVLRNGERRWTCVDINYINGFNKPHAVFLDMQPPDSKTYLYSTNDDIMRGTLGKSLYSVAALKKTITDHINAFFLNENRILNFTSTEIVSINSTSGVVSGGYLSTNYRLPEISQIIPNCRLPIVYATCELSRTFSYFLFNDPGILLDVGESCWTNSFTSSETNITKLNVENNLVNPKIFVCRRDFSNVGRRISYTVSGWDSSRKNAVFVIVA